jgi:hypothetical protein
VHVTVRHDGARLLIVRQGREMELIPVGPLEFEVESGFQAPIRFARDAAGRIAELKILLAEPRRALRTR